MKLLELPNIPLEIVPLTGPEVVPGITSTTSVLEDWLIGTAAIPPMLTDCVLEKSVPVIVTRVPTGPDEGEIETGMVEGTTVVLKPPPQPAERRKNKKANFFMSPPGHDTFDQNYSPIGPESL